LTILGIGIGVAAIIGLGAFANGLEGGYRSMLTGSKADLILSQPDIMDISYSSVDESIGAELQAAPEVSEVSGMLQGFAQVENEPIFFVFGHPLDSFALGRFQIVEGVGLDDRELRHAHGKPILLGSAAAEVMDKEVGDTLRVIGSSYRIAGIYETGDAFEDSGALLDLEEAQNLLGKQRQVSIYYIRLKDQSLKERFVQRVERRWPDLAVSGIAEFGEQQLMEDFLRGFMWAIGGLAILIGGVGMMNSQLMSVYERTREIGALRAVGWSSGRVLRMILMETITVSVLGGVLGALLGWLLISSLSKATIMLGMSTDYISSNLLVQAFFVVLILGLVGGLYPSLRASRLQPVEALRYEGGSSGNKARRLPFGGVAVQSLWQRSTRTLLTLGVIGLTVGAIMALDGIVQGAFDEFNQAFLGTNAEILMRQADVSDTSLSAIDERVGDKIAAMPEVANISGFILTAVVMPDSGGFFLLQGYAPNEVGIQRLDIVEGERLNSNHQIILGSTIAAALNKGVGDTIDLSGVRFRVAGIYESDVSWEELGGVVTLRDAQAFMGRPRKVTMYSVKLHDGSQAQAVVEKINAQFPEVHATLSGEFMQQMPDMRSSEAMMGGISFMAVVIGGVGVLNAMLMAVFERTREIGVLRALGWRRRAILGMILREALYLGLLGGVAGIGLAFLITYLIQMEPTIGSMLAPAWDFNVIVRAIIVAVSLGVIGGLYPAYRATRLQPVEALRYE
jgi:ABC-type lipoprotein release transport system permease subunit